MCPALKARLPDWDPIRGSHHGQQPKWLHQQAEYMTAPDHRGNVRFPLHRGRRRSWKRACVSLPGCSTPKP